MPSCLRCSSPVAAADRFCPSCGTPVPRSDESPTIVSDAPERREDAISRSASDGRRISVSDPGHGARFVPGTILAGRYRVVGLIGRGGMGEIYRADDLKLGQAVALKLLPEAVARSASALERFGNEVRLARQVSHPNVCRVYDIGEADGLHYITMEYVDGEDLASLLRRIGRLPQDRAVVIARQICAGLAAAHERGMLHRDLKPENIMIDGRGTARLTDFGLAAFAADLRGAEVRSGTPAYMAPEALEGRDLSARSDVYSLGLVLYEMFTGKQVFDGPTLADVTRQRAEARVTRPTDFVEGLNPTVERVILRCLDPDPSQRPASAMAVAMALPGGDPLRAALEAGELPSPEMVAAAGAERSLRPAHATVLLGACFLLLAALAVFGDRFSILHVVPFERPPDALLERSREFLRRLGVTAAAADHAHGIDVDRDVLRWMRSRDATADRWKPLESGRTGVLTYWYRQSPRSLFPLNLGGAVGFGDPNPYAVSGMAGLWLDEGGRLAYFLHVPPQEPGAGPEVVAEPDWGTLFDLAGLEPARFRPVEPRWVPPIFADRRAAWEGEVDDLPGIPMRVEAASFRGHPVYFETVLPWTRATRMQPFVESTSRRIAQTLNIVLVAAGLLGSAALARRSIRTGRGDRRGATRLASWAFAVMLIDWLLTANHQSSAVQQWNLFLRGAGISLFVSTFVWVLYLGLEPSVRRRWPDALISWSRLLAGRLRDPLVGRDLLIGISAAGVTGLVAWGVSILQPLVGTPVEPFVPAVGAILSLRELGSWLLSNQVNSLLAPMLFLLLLATLRQWLRSTAAAFAVTLLLLATMVVSAQLGEAPSWVAVIGGVLPIAILLAVLVRYGLLALVVAIFVGNVAGVFPMTTSPTDWYFGYSSAILAIVAALAVYGYAAVRGAKVGQTSP